ncbi:MAG TPA: hypothetical protein ENJ45_01080, partial [Phaeodactylibacter sp.]|nr:hypothetical protein [Phaeodactylibacter sp.]
MMIFDLKYLLRKKANRDSCLMNYLHLRYTFLFIFLFLYQSTDAALSKLRCMWREDPATTMVIAWHQESGTDPLLHYDYHNGGNDPASYTYHQTADRVVKAKGMNNHFVRLKNLKPNTLYYFIISDSEGCSQRYSFKTTPDNSYEPLSIVAGGDSRNYRKARRNANKLVAKLHPHCVLFGGDMTGGDTAKEWLEWFDDWQYTIDDQGHMTPIVVTRGNHEYSNKTLVDLFDVPNDKLYYALSFGGDLLRVYTLNSLIASGGNQRKWLEKDLQAHSHMLWRFAQYHFAIRPHTRAKREQNGQLKNWATLFYDYGVKLVMESDAHVVKLTHPLRPSRGQGSDEGFIRDDLNGTTYIGEGCWGAPLRRNNDDKVWTKASGSFNQFKLLFVTMDGVEVRTIKTDNADMVSSNSLHNPFILPKGLDVWAPNGEPVLYIRKNTKVLATHTQHSTPQVYKQMLLRDNVVWCDDNGLCTIQWRTEHEYDDGATFEVQRSVNRQAFTTFALVEARASIGGINNYRIEDNRQWKAGEEWCYRLKHVSGNGNTIYYKLENEGTGTTEWSDYKKLHPNPETGLVKVKYKVKEASDVAISLLDDEQVELKKSFYKNKKTGNYSHSIDVSALPK